MTSSKSVQEKRANLNVLMIEDHEHFRQFTAAVLERAGFNVFQAADRIEAQEAWNEENGQIDVVLADVFVGMENGPEIALEMQSKRPGLDVILMSGNEWDFVAEKSKPVEGALFLKKPFKMNVLIDALDASGDRKEASQLLRAA